MDFHSSKTKADHQTFTTSPNKAPPDNPKRRIVLGKCSGSILGGGILRAVGGSSDQALGPWCCSYRATGHYLIEFRCFPDLVLPLARGQAPHAEAGVYFFSCLQNQIHLFLFIDAPRTMSECLDELTPLQRIQSRGVYKLSAKSLRV